MWTPCTPFCKNIYYHLINHFTHDLSLSHQSVRHSLTNYFHNEPLCFQLSNIWLPHYPLIKIINGVAINIQPTLRTTPQTILFQCNRPNLLPYYYPIDQLTFFYQHLVNYVANTLQVLPLTYKIFCSSKHHINYWFIKQQIALLTL